MLKDSAVSMFSPALSDKKMTAIESYGAGAIDKIFLRYDKIWWEPAPDNQGQNSTKLTFLINQIKAFKKIMKPNVDCGFQGLKYWLKAGNMYVQYLIG